MDELLKVGIIIKPHGVFGEAKVFPTTDDAKRFKKLKEVILKSERDGEMTLNVLSAKLFKNIVILKFAEFASPEEIDRLRGAELFVTRENAVKLQKGEYFIADLIGLTAVSEDGTLRGEVYDVLQTGANDVYVLHLSDGKELLIPAIRDCIRSIDLEQKLLTFHLMDGLM